MNLNMLFEMQNVLDERIVREKGLEGQDLLPNKILALQVELGELANEWQLFKHWKVDPQPKPKMLEEYVDCIHFVLSLGIDKGYDALSEEIEEFVMEFRDGHVKYDIIDQFNYVFDKIGDFHTYQTQGNYAAIFIRFVVLGEMLGFTWKQVSDAYMLKNQINHARQDNWY